MRRICTTVMASTALALALPGVASAHHHGRHHRAHRSRTITFQAHKTTTTTTAPGVPPITKTEPTPGSEEAAGVVTSYENGVLTITLADKSVVSGKVVEGSTEIGCPSAGGETGDDDNSEGDEQNASPPPGSPGHEGDDGGFAGSHGDDMSGGPSSGGDDQDDQGDDDGNETSSCGTSALKPGAKVSEAELHISSAGAVWEKVILA